MDSGRSVWAKGDIRSLVRLVSGPWEKCIDLGRDKITSEIVNWTLGEVYRLRER